MGVAEDKTRIVLTVSKDLKLKLDKQAKKENRSVANLINMLISDYVWKSEEMEQQLYLNYLANCYLNNMYNYNYYVQELQSQGFNYTSTSPDQTYFYVRSYLISNYKHTLLQYGEENGFTLEKFNQLQQLTTNQPFGLYHNDNNNYNGFYIPPKKD